MDIDGYIDGKWQTINMAYCHASYGYGCLWAVSKARKGFWQILNSASSAKVIMGICGV